MADWIPVTNSSATIQRWGKRADSTVKVAYRVINATGDAEVHAEAQSFFSVNSTYVAGGYTLYIDSYDITNVANGVFDVTATYTKKGLDDSGQPFNRSRSFDTTGATQHYTQAFTERSYSASGTAPSFGGAINASGDTVAGVDVVVPSLQWSETYDVPAVFVTAAYIRSVAGLTGTVNLGAFRGFGSGEVLFAGCSGSQEWDSEKGDGPWSLAYKFIASPGYTDLTVGSITGISKGGHEYLWVRYDDAVESDSMVKVPKHVYVNEVYKRANFAALGIG